MNPFLLLRILGALALVPLLYRALGEPGEGWGKVPASIARRAFFAFLGAATLFLLTANWMPRTERVDAGRAFEAYTKGSHFHRLSFLQNDMVTSQLDGKGPLNQAVENLREAVKRSPESVQYGRHLGLALAGKGQYPEALKTLNRAMDSLAKRAPERAAAERALWEKLFGKRVPRPEEVAAAREQLEGYQLGWLTDVAAVAAYRRTEAGPPPALQNQLQERAASYIHRSSASTLIAFLCIPQLALISIIMVVVMVKNRVLRPAEQNLHPVGAILWESFILMLALGVLPGLITFGGRRPAPETNPGAIAALMVAGDLVQGVALLYLWLRLRGRGLNLAEIGLSWKGLGANILIGVMAATVIMPASAILGIVTQAVSDKLFPNIAPPYHPLSGMTAGTGNAEIRFALLAAAAIGAPLFEEIFFRGALFGALRRRFGLWVGLAGSAAFFSILHPQLPLGFIPIAFLGAAFAALYEWRQSLIPGMVAHAINNGLIFLMLTFTFPSKG